MINLHERMLPTSAGVEPATSWSPVGQRIQLSHRGRLTTEREFQFLTGSKETNHINFCKITCTLNADSDQPAHLHTPISLCYLDKDPKQYILQYVMKTDQTVQADLNLH